MRRRPHAFDDDLDGYGYGPDPAGYGRGSYGQGGGYGPGPENEPEDDIVFVAEEQGLFRRAGAVLAFLLLFSFVVLGLGGYWVYSQINPTTPQGEEITVTIPQDSGISAIATILEDQGVITNATVFQYYARARGIGPVRAGDYDRLRKNEPMDQVIERLEAGPIPIRFTDLPVPEGLWLADTAARTREAFPLMDDIELVTALNSVRSVHQPEGKPLDGFLFPATYRVTEKQYGDERALVEQMVAKFDRVAEDLGLEQAPNRLAGSVGREPLTPYDVLKVASLVEAEAKVPEDRARIARVIYNRLRQGMKLEIDATVLVALGQHKESLTPADLQVDSPYNLRRYPGLPPTPINSPGTDSLRAAINPSTEPGSDKWLYYVLVDRQGHHSFSATREEHDRKAAQARREGVF
jgi:UPF0755 protein